MTMLRRQSDLLAIPDDPEYYTWSTQGRLAGVVTLLMTCALVAVLIRIYIRIFLLHVFRIDDYFIVAAVIFSSVGCSIFLHTISLGMGKHIFAMPSQNFEPLLMWMFIFAIMNPLALSFTKISIAFFLLPLTRQTRYRKLLWSVIVIVAALLVFSFFTLIFGCIPIEANWKFALKSPPIGSGTAKCIQTTTYRDIALFNSIQNLLTDIVLALIPVPLVWKLQVNKRTKASLIFILSLGFFACAAGIIKTPLQWHFFDDADSTGKHAWYYGWQIIEMNIGIIAATLPSLKPAFRWLLETAKNIATGVSANRTGGSHAYKRHVSSGYLRHKDQYVGSSSGMSGRPDAIEMELKAMGTYDITIAGSGDEGSGSGFGRGKARGSQGSEDAILRAEAGLGGKEARSIVKTTKVTVITT